MDAREEEAEEETADRMEESVLCGQMAGRKCWTRNVNIAYISR